MTKHPEIYYAIHELPSHRERLQGKEIGVCLTDGYTRSEAVLNAEEWLCRLDQEEGRSGRNDRTVILVTTDDTGDTTKETLEEIELTWVA